MLSFAFQSVFSVGLVYLGVGFTLHLLHAWRELGARLSRPRLPASGDRPVLPGRPRPVRVGVVQLPPAPAPALPSSPPLGALPPASAIITAEQWAEFEQWAAQAQQQVPQQCPPAAPVLYLPPRPRHAPRQRPSSRRAVRRRQFTRLVAS